MFRGGCIVSLCSKFRNIRHVIRTHISTSIKIGLLLFVLLLNDQRKYIGWELASARSVQSLISFKRLNTSNSPIPYTYLCKMYTYWVTFWKYICYVLNNINEIMLAEASLIPTKTIQKSLCQHVSKHLLHEMFLTNTMLKFKNYCFFFF